MEETIKRLKRYSEQCIAERLDPDFAEGIVDTIVYLETIVAMQKMKGETEVKRGKWEYDLGGIPQCSCCEETALQRILLRFPKPEYVSHFVLSNFCPHCGARMDKDGDGDV